MFRIIRLVEPEAHPVKDVNERLYVVPHFVPEVPRVGEQYCRYELPSTLRAVLEVSDSSAEQYNSHLQFAYASNLLLAPTS